MQTTAAESSDWRSRILARVERVPPGFVTTYGDVSPGAPRQGGAALRGAGDRVPWWRVVRADGSLAVGDRQRALLEAEDVPFLPSGRVDLRAARIPPEVL
ncbi:cysteine methyltransferase [Paraconexibacter algicola]|uniref:Cysteine methyltransferase n=1 Tax=Paraconexibacter algicola TaxID=2133960 RepID=A0A2T4UN85_9ACTN|nr:cysteine methyltransferase [Paraconexibacter algicola]